MYQSGKSPIGDEKWPHLLVVGIPTNRDAPANHSMEPFAMQQLLTLQVHNTHHLFKDLLHVCVFTHVQAHM